MLTVMAAQDSVFLLHGMGRSRVSLLWLRHHLLSQGYDVHLFGYSTARQSLDEISRAFLAFVQQRAPGRSYHLIGHSLGNIIARNAFRFGYPDGLGRMVMLAPPNRPAKLAGELRHNPLFRRLTGDCGRKLGDPTFYAELPVPPVPFGVIAGGRGQRLTFDEPNDGIVAVEATKLSGMADWLLVPNIHSFIMNARVTREQCVHFIEHGRFHHG